MGKNLACGFLAVSLLSIVAFLFSIHPITRAEGENNVLIVFDASGSMREDFGGQTRITAAKSAVSDFLRNLGPDVQVGLRPYGHVAHPGDEPSVCRETELVQDFTATHTR